MNNLGIGFAFVGKDAGLTKIEQDVARGLATISESMGGIDLASRGLESSLVGFGGALAQAVGGADADVGGIAERVALVSDAFATVKDRAGELIGSFQALGQEAAAQAFGDQAGVAAAQFSEFGEQVEEVADQDMKRAAKTFGKRSDDIESSQSGVIDGFKGIGDVVKKMNSILQVNRLATFLQAVSVGMLDKIKSGIDQLSESGSNLTTGLEAEMVSMGKTARSEAANLGYMGAELANVTSAASGMAKSLNVDVGSATRAIYGFNQAAGELSALGIKSAEDLAKLAETTGVDAKEFAVMTKRMRTEFGMADKDIQRVVSSFTAMGQSSGDVKGSLGSLPGLMKDLASRAALLDLKPEELAEFAAQTASVAAGYAAMGMSADDARSEAMGLAGSMIESQKGMRNLVAGVEGDIPGLATSMGIATGDLSKSFQLLAGGPADVMKGMQQMASMAKGDARKTDALLQFMSAHLGQAGINTDALVNYLRRATPAMQATAASVAKANVNLSSFASSAFTTGRTLQESFDMAKEAMVARFRAGSDAGTKFVGRFQAATTGLMDRVDAISKKGGPMGKFVDKMREMHQIGFAALLPQTLQPMGVLFSQMTTQLVPLIGALGAMGLRFTMLLNPLMLVGAAFVYLMRGPLAGMVKNLKAVYDRTGSVGEVLKALPGELGKLWESAGEVLGEMMAKALDISTWLRKKVEGVNWKQFFVGVGKSIRKAIASIGNIGKELIGGLFGSVEDATKDQSQVGQLGSNLATIFSSIFSGLWEALKEIDVKELFKSVLGMLSRALNMVKGAAKQIDFGALAGGILDVFTGALGAVDWRGLASSVVSYWMTMLDTLARGLMDVLDQVFDRVGKMDLSAVASQILNALLDALIAALDTLSGLYAAIEQRMPGWLESLKTGIVAWFKGLPGMATQALKDFGPKLKEGLKKLIPTVLSVYKNILVFLFNLIVDIIKQLPELLPKIGEFMWQAFLFVVEVIYEILGGIAGWVWDNVISPIVDYFKSFLPMDDIQAVWDDFVALIQPVIDRLVALWEPFKQFMLNAWEGIKIIAEFVWSAIKIGAQVLVGLLKMWWEGFKITMLALWEVIKVVALFVWDTIKVAIFLVITLVTAAWDVFAAAMTILWEGIKVVASAAWIVILTVITAVKDAVVLVWDTLTEWFSALWEGIKTVASTVWDLIKGIVTDPVETIKTAWDTLKTFIMDMWEAIKTGVQDAIDEIKKKWDEFTEFVEAPFEKISEWSDKLFGNSISTDIAGDLEKTEDVLKTFGDKIVEHLRVTLADTIQTSLTTSFSQGFDAALKSLRLFRRKFMVEFHKLMNRMKMAFGDTMLAIATMMDALMENIGSLIFDLTSRMEDVSRSLNEILTAQNQVKEVERYGASVSTEEGTTPRSEFFSSLKTADRAILDTLNKPEWWGGTEPDTAQMLLTRVADGIESLRGVLSAYTAAATIRGAGTAQGAVRAAAKTIGLELPAPIPSR